MQGSGDLIRGGGGPKCLALKLHHHIVLCKLNGFYILSLTFDYLHSLNFQDSRFSDVRSVIIFNLLKRIKSSSCCHHPNWYQHNQITSIITVLLCRQNHCWLRKSPEWLEPSSDWFPCLLYSCHCCRNQPTLSFSLHSTHNVV